jgi:hypothetical protein
VRRPLPFSIRFHPPKLKKYAMPLEAFALDFRVGSSGGNANKDKRIVARSDS